MTRDRVVAPLLAAALALCIGVGAHAASRAPVAAEHGMVVTAQHLATRVGVDVLRDGGNAVDAAVAVGYALAVVYPAAGNPDPRRKSGAGARVLSSAWRRGRR